MIKRTLLSINFTEKENRLIDAALSKINPALITRSSTLNELESQHSNLSKVSLILLKLNDDDNLTADILKRIKIKSLLTSRLSSSPTLK